MTDTVPFAGAVDPRFEPVREAFVANFAPSEGDPGDLGAAVAVVVDGRTVVDLWGGWCHPDRSRRWERDTLVNVYSIGKALAAVAVLALVERGELALDEPVVRWWPEFAAGGKDSVTLRQMLAHRAGLPAVREELADDAMLEWAVMAEALAATEPWWEPDTAHGYHTNTLGFLVGEPARRVRGQRFGEIVAELVTRPAGADLYIGLPPSEHSRVATVELGVALPTGDAIPRQGDDLLDRMRTATYFNPPGLSGFGVVNTAGWRSAEIPSTNAHGTALAVARVFTALSGAADPSSPPLLGDDLLTEATTEHSAGRDLVLDRSSRFGLGLILPQDERPVGLGDSSFGHYGYGGSLGFADPDARVGFGYVINRPGDRWQVPRTRRLLAALADCF